MSCTKFKNKTKDGCSNSLFCHGFTMLDESLSIRRHAILYCS
uniref:Uncharacterized protein n=1 Tax=Anguilla anguilla TaxID=7936 RepID=A0A0E9S8Q5_ANGAN